MNCQTLRSILMPNCCTSHRESRRQESSSRLGVIVHFRMQSNYVLSTQIHSWPGSAHMDRNKVTTTRSALGFTTSAHKKSWYSRSTFSWGHCYQILRYLVKIHSCSCNFKQKIHPMDAWLTKWDDVASSSVTGISQIDMLHCTTSICAMRLLLCRAMPS